MNQQKRHMIYPLAALALGITGSGLRAMLYALATDEKGLLRSHHPAGIAAWLLAAAAFILAFAASRGPWKKNRTPDSAGRRISAGLGDLLLGAAVLASLILGMPEGFPALLPVRKALVFLCFAAMAASGVLRILGRKLPFFLPAAASLFFLFNTLTSYPVWSRDPQLMDYAFTLGAELCLCLFSYYQAALTLGLPGRKQRLAAGLLGLFFCCASIPGDFALIHAAGAVHILTILLSARPAEVRP